MATTQPLTLEEKIERFRKTSWFRKANHKQRTRACNLLAHQTYWGHKFPFKLDPNWLKKNHPKGKKYIAPKTES